MISILFNAVALHVRGTKGVEGKKKVSGYIQDPSTTGGETHARGYANPKPGSIIEPQVHPMSSARDTCVNRVPLGKNWHGKPCAICSGDQQCASRCKTAARKRAWMVRLMSPTLRPVMGGYRAIGDRRCPMVCAFRDSVLGLAVAPKPPLGDYGLSPICDSILRAP